MHNNKSLCAEDKVAQTQRAEAKRILLAYQHKGLQEKERTLWNFFVKYNIQQQLTAAKNVLENIQEVGMYFFAIKETPARFGKLSVH